MRLRRDVRLSKFETQVAEMQAHVFELESSLQSSEELVTQQTNSNQCLVKEKENSLLVEEDLKQQTASLRVELDEARNKFYSFLVIVNCLLTSYTGQFRQIIISKYDFCRSLG